MANFPDYKTVSVDKLIPYVRNSRTHSDEQVAQIAASIKEFGFLRCSDRQNMGESKSILPARKNKRG